MRIRQPLTFCAIWAKMSSPENKCCCVATIVQIYFSFVGSMFFRNVSSALSSSWRNFTPETPLEAASVWKWQFSYKLVSRPKCANWKKLGGWKIGYLHKFPFIIFPVGIYQKCRPLLNLDLLLILLIFSHCAVYLVGCSWLNTTKTYLSIKDCHTAFHFSCTLQLFLEHIVCKCFWQQLPSYILFCSEDITHTV